MKVLKRIGIVVGSLLLLLIMIGFFLPADWRVERSVVIRAKPEAIHPWIDDMAKWKEWSPFDSEDPAMTIEISTPSAGVGSWREWKSEKMGNGRMDVVKSDPAKGVWMTLTMEGWEAFTIDFLYEPAGDGATKVTWVDTGKAGANPFHRWMIQCMDTMMGPYFERGLGSLKTLAEGGPAK